jgi:N-acetyltransferase 10
MVRGLNSSGEGELGWLGEFAKGTWYQLYCMSTRPLTSSQDFRKRFLSLLSFKFREFAAVTALSVIEAANSGIKVSSEEQHGSYHIDCQCSLAHCVIVQLSHQRSWRFS